MCGGALGDAQVLDEIQVLMYDGATATAANEENDNAIDTAKVNGFTISTDVNPFFGRVLYTNGPTIDQPLSILRMNYVDTMTVAGVSSFAFWSPFTIVPQWDYRGQPINGFFTVPSPAHKSIVSNCIDTKHCVWISWPLGWLAYNRKFFIPVSWHGSVVEGERDGAETLYRRNRQCDPATGRFTQEDPLGLAGGINAYAFANGDPLDLADPFGLCPDSLRADGDQCQKWNQVQVDSAKKIVDAERARGNKYANSGVTDENIAAVNADQIEDICGSNQTLTGCSDDVGNMAVNADRNPWAISQTIVHERQHMLNRGKVKGLERCAIWVAIQYVLAMTATDRQNATSGNIPAYTSTGESARGCF